MRYIGLYEDFCNSFEFRWAVIFVPPVRIISMDVETVLPRACYAVEPVALMRLIVLLADDVYFYGVELPKAA